MIETKYADRPADLRDPATTPANFSTTEVFSDVERQRKQSPHWPYASDEAKVCHEQHQKMTDQERKEAREARIAALTTHAEVTHGPLTIRGGKCYRGDVLDDRFEPARLSFFAPNLRCSGNCVEIPDGWRKRYGWDGSKSTEAAITDLIHRCGLRSHVFEGGGPKTFVNKNGWLVPIAEWDKVMDAIVGVNWNRAKITDAEAMAVLNAK